MSETENGKYPDNPKIFTIKGENGEEASFMDWGATILSFHIPNKDNSGTNNLILSTIPSRYIQQNICLGAIIGRVGNRISNGTFYMDGSTYFLSLPAGHISNNLLHSGDSGWQRRRFTGKQINDSTVMFTLTDPSGTGGFPGTLSAEIIYSFTQPQETKSNVSENDDYISTDLTLTINLTAKGSTPANVTSHVYWNLDDSPDILDHTLQINAESFIETNNEGIPTGEILPSAGTFIDFTSPKVLKEPCLKAEKEAATNGIDHTVILKNKSTPAATLIGKKGIKLELFTDFPALQIYTGNATAGVPSGESETLGCHAGIALEGEMCPDAVNHPELPGGSSVIKTGEQRTNFIRWHISRKK